MNQFRPPTVIFCDAENIFFTLQNHGLSINTFNLIPWLRQRFGPFMMYVYGHFSANRGLPLLFRNNLDEFPEVLVFETNIDSHEKPVPQQADNALIRAMTLKNIGFMANIGTYQNVVIMSGDGSLLTPAIQAWSLGMNVTIIAATPASTNRSYKGSLLNIVYLQDYPELFNAQSLGNPKTD